MGDKIPSITSAKRVTARLESLEFQQQLISRDRKVPTRPIANALIKAGYLSLDAQAKALGVSRSTAWTIVNTKQKLGRLNNKTARCILANPNAPASVHVIIRTMLDRKN